MVEAGATTEQSRMLGLAYPAEVYSLSHVAIPFPMTDSLYGMHPGPEEHFGVHLGAIAARGEVGALIVTLDSLIRMSSNPFFPYMLERIEAGIGGRPASASSAAVSSTPVRESPPANKPPAASSAK
jgi:hypothetical protein